MTTVNNSISLFLISVILLTTGCGKSSPVNTSELFSDITVLVTDENGNPVQDIIIDIYQASLSDTTGIHGIVVFEQVPGNFFKVSGKKLGRPDFSKDIRVGNDSEINVHFIIFSELILHIKNDFNRPLSDIEINTSPSIETVTTDENGTAVLKDVPGRDYTLLFSRSQLPQTTQQVALGDSLNNQLDIVIQSEMPTGAIQKPEDNTVIGAYNAVLTGSGTDYEDGELDDDNFVWSSNQDGKLGTGKSISPDNLTYGDHIIQLEITDSDGKVYRSRISVTVVDYDPSSFFPMKQTAFWEYHHLEPNFFVINRNNVKEYWEIKDLTITIEDRRKRTSTVLYDRTSGTITTHAEFKVVDYFEVQNETVSITRTIEKLREWQSSKEEDNPYSVINVDSNYSPPLTIISDITGLSVNTSVDYTVNIETDWYYVYYNQTSSEFHLSGDVTTTIETGDLQLVTTEIGLLKALEVSIIQENSSKKWWLCQGLGLVRLDYSISEIEQTAVLSNSDLLAIYFQNNPAENAKRAPGTVKSKPLTTYRLSSNHGDALMELRTILKGMLP